MMMLRNIKFNKSLFNSVFTGYLGYPTPAAKGREAGSTLEKTPVPMSADIHRQTHTFTFMVTAMVSLDQPICLLRKLLL